MSDARDLKQENRVLRERIAQLEAATRDEDPILRALVEHTPQFICVVSPEGRHIATGRPSEAFGNILGRSVFEFTDPSSHETLERAFEQACATREPVTYEVLGYSEDGEPGHTYRVRAVPLCRGDSAHALLLVPTDITDRVRLERSLIERTEALRLAVNASHMGFWRWDVAGNRVEWDDRLLALFGTTSAPSRYEEYLELIHPEDRDHARSIVTEAWQTGVYRTFEHRIAPRGDGVDKWVLCVGTTRRGENGEVSTLQGGVLDITEKKSLASHLWRAERAQTIGELSAGFAHNFNNLLAVMVPHLEMSAEQQKGEAASAALEASLQARDLVRSMLVLAGRRAGEESTRDLVFRVEAMCRMTFPKEITLSTSVEADVGAVVLPSTDLEQVLLNLLFNARDALEPREGPDRRIDVVVDRITDTIDGRRVRFRISDNGPGVPNEIRAKIFEPFFTTKTSQRRAGLGLASALARVQAVSGRLELECSGPSKTTFTLILPELVSQPSAVTFAGGEAPAHPAPNGRSRETILIVDDEPLVRGVVRRLLESEGYLVHEVGSAAEARDLLRGMGSSVDAIILDQSMPREPGLEALPSLVALTDASVILFTGLVPDVVPGAAAILEKPAMASDIFRVVREVLDRRHQRPG